MTPERVPGTVFQSLAQGDLGADGHNFEAVIVEGGNLVHWWRGNDHGGKEWKRGQILSSGVAGAGALIQSDFKGGDHGNFEVVVPLHGAGGFELWHFFHDNTDASTPWQRGQRIATNVAGPGSLLQSDFKGGDHGNFEVVVPLHGAGGFELWHFFHDNSDAGKPWERGQLITRGAAGPGALIQSDFKGGDHGNFEVVVPLHGAGGFELWHFFHDNSDAGKPWERGQLITRGAAGPGALIQSDFKGGDHGNFEVVVPLHGAGGFELWHFFHDNSDPSRPWQRGQLVSDSARGWASLIQRSFGPWEHHHFDVLLEECSRSVVAYWHPNEDVRLPWLRDATLISEPPPRKLGGTRKIVQLTGEFEREGWKGYGVPPRAPNRTESAFGIRGTDLGVSFRHHDRLLFLFGDTWRVDQREEDVNLDAIAFTRDEDADDGLTLQFLHPPPRIRPPISQREFEVPLDGVSVGDRMFVFFSTDHVGGAAHRWQFELMGRSVLTRSVDAIDFEFLCDFSRGRFINVSVERATLTGEQARHVGLSPGTEVVWIWGSGRYRSSAVYLAVMPVSGLFERLAGLRYFAGAGRWSHREEDAAPLFCAGSVGELSVRHNRWLSRYLALFNSYNPRGILLHSAPEPWGPWTSAPVQVFDPADGYCRFMHRGWQESICDHVQDDILPPFTRRDNTYGGEYGPYQIAPFATAAAGGGSRIYFTMSTWNPYQVMLMMAIVPSDVT